MLQQESEVRNELTNYFQCLTYTRSNIILKDTKNFNIM
jgi:hypothetical protein